jgi:co-chaperonin GroES (HSP10)
MEVKYKPKFGRVLIRRKVEEKIGGIILPNAKRHAKCEGEILALGETAGLTEIPGQDVIQTLKIGDKVIFGLHAGVWLDGTYSVDGQSDNATLFMCQDQDILAVIEE